MRPTCVWLSVPNPRTAGREICEDLSALGVKPDVAVIGASGGGLMAGISLALKARVPDISIYAVEPEGFDDTIRSFKSGQRERNERMSGTICDALMTDTPGVRLPSGSLDSAARWITAS